MTPQELKNSILQLAIQGKLVEQRPEEGTAAELYKQIQAEKQALIKAGKIKKEKPLPEIAEDEVPFEIPESWMWVRLRNIVFNRGQETPTEEFCYIDIGSLDNKRQRLNETETLVSPENAPSRARKLVEYGDILYSTVRPYLHNMCIIDRSFSHNCSSVIVPSLNCFFVSEKAASALFAILLERTTRAFKTAFTFAGYSLFPKPFPSLYQRRLVIRSRETAKSGTLSFFSSFILSACSFEINNVVLELVTSK